MCKNSSHVCFIDNGSTRGRERYALEEQLTRCLPDILRPSSDVEITDKGNGTLVKLTSSGCLTVHPGYAWDGPSGPAPDTPELMRGSLVHDALYQLLREGHLFELEQDAEESEHRHDTLRRAADELLIKMCEEDGMSRPLRRLVWAAVKWFGAGAARRRGGFDQPVASPTICYAPLQRQRT